MVKDLKIVLDQDASQEYYRPGSVVSGSLVVELDEAKKIKQIVVYLEGKGQVNWMQHIGQISSANSSEELFFCLEIVVWTDSKSENGTLPAGRHVFPFCFTLPVHCPSSFQDGIGMISYSIQGKVTSDWAKLDHGVFHEINVLEEISTDIPAVQRPVRELKQKQVGSWCGSYGMISYDAELPRVGFHVGENIPLQVTLENGSRRKVRIKAALVLRIAYVTPSALKLLNKFLVVKRSELLSAHSTNVWSPSSFIVPELQSAVTRSKIIKSFYCVWITVEIPWAIDSILRIPVLIGNADNQDSK